MRDCPATTWPYRSTRQASRTHQEAILAQFGKVAKGHAMLYSRTRHASFLMAHLLLRRVNRPLPAVGRVKLYHHPHEKKMKAAFVVLAIAGLASAAGKTMFDALPECSHECLTKSIKGSSNCKPEDSECLCEVDNYRSIYSGAEACVLQACGAAKSVGKSAYLDT